MSTPTRTTGARHLWIASASIRYDVVLNLDFRLSLIFYMWRTGVYMFLSIYILMIYPTNYSTDMTAICITSCQIWI